MVTSTSFPILACVAVFLFVKTSANETTVSCLKVAIVDLTGMRTDSSGYPEKLGKVYPPNSTSPRGDKKLGCPRTLKKCIPLCCNLTEARQEGICVKDLSVLSRNITLIHEDYRRQEIAQQYYHSFKNDPCAIGWMTSSLTKNVSVFKNGSIYAPEFNGGLILDLDQYCLLWEPKSTRYVAKVCRPWIQKDYFGISCLILGTLLMLAIFVTYTITHPLENLHGSIFRSYTATYAGIYVFSMGVMFTAGLRINAFWFSFFETGVRYFGLSSAFWLNMMSFNIWRSFRSLRPPSCDTKEEERKKFMYCAVYAWLGPIVLIAIAAAIMHYVPYIQRDTIDELFKRWSTVTVVIFSLICNIYLYGSTVFSIRKHKQDTADIVAGVNKHSDIEKQWFNLYCKLFVIMGAHMVVWPIFLIWPSQTLIHIMGVMEVFQGTLILVIFIWNDSVKQLLRTQFREWRTKTFLPRIHTITQRIQQTPRRLSRPR